MSFYFLLLMIKADSQRMETSSLRRCGKPSARGAAQGSTAS